MKRYGGKGLRQSVGNARVWGVWVMLRAHFWVDLDVGWDFGGELKNHGLDLGSELLWVHT